MDAHKWKTHISSFCFSLLRTLCCSSTLHWKSVFWDLLLVHSWPRTNVPPGVVLAAPPPPPRIQVNSHSLEKLLIHSRELFPDAPWQELRFWHSCAGLRPNTLSWFWCFSSRWLPKLIPLATKWKWEEPEEPWSVTDLLYFTLQNKLLQANSQGEL